MGYEREELFRLIDGLPHDATLTITPVASVRGTAVRIERPHPKTGVYHGYQQIVSDIERRASGFPIMAETVIRTLRVFDERMREHTPCP